MNKGAIQSSAKDEKAQSVYEMYYNYEEPVKKAAGHRILALNRGENEKMLTVKVLATSSQKRYIWKMLVATTNPSIDMVNRDRKA